jgi:hypothetical protein
MKHPPVQMTDAEAFAQFERWIAEPVPEVTIRPAPRLVPALAGQPESEEPAASVATLSTQQNGNGLHAGFRS